MEKSHHGPPTSGHTQPPCSRRVQIPRPIIVQPRLLIQLFGVEQVGRSPTAIAFFHKHLAVRDIHHILSDVSVKVRHHGGTAEVVGMVEVENWCRVGCRLGVVRIANPSLFGDVKNFYYDGRNCAFFMTDLLFFCLHWCIAYVQSFNNKINIFSHNSYVMSQIS